MGKRLAPRLLRWIQFHLYDFSISSHLWSIPYREGGTDGKPLKCNLVQHLFCLAVKGSRIDLFSNFLEQFLKESERTEVNTNSKQIMFNVLIKSQSLSLGKFSIALEIKRQDRKSFHLQSEGKTEPNTRRITASNQNHQAGDEPR